VEGSSEEVMKLRVPRKAGKPSSGYTTGGISSGAQLHRSAC
jgi:hypothetical protein